MALLQKTTEEKESQSRRSMGTVARPPPRTTSNNTKPVPPSNQTTPAANTTVNTTQSNPAPIYRTLDAYAAAVKAAPGYGQVYAYVWSQSTRQTCSATSWFKTLFFRLNVPAKIDNVNCVLLSSGIAYTADLADVTGTQNGDEIVEQIPVSNVVEWAKGSKICAPDLHIMIMAVASPTASFELPDARKSWSCSGVRNSVKVPALCAC